MMDNGMAMGSGMFFFGLLLVLGLIVLVVVVVRAARSGIRPDGSDNPNRLEGPVESQARRLVDERYARGELAEEEYQERLRVLEQRD